MPGRIAEADVLKVGQRVKFIGANCGTAAWMPRQGDKGVIDDVAPGGSEAIVEFDRHKGITLPRDGNQPPFRPSRHTCQCHAAELEVVP